MKTERTEEEWAEIIKAYRESGQSLRAWGLAHGINIKTLSNHTKSNYARKDNPRKRTAAEWRALIEELDASGLSRSEWCRRNRINAHALDSARHRLAANNEPNAHLPEKREKIEFVKVHPAKPAPSTEAHIKITIGNVTIEADSKYPLDELVTIVQKLAAQC